MKKWLLVALLCVAGFLVRPVWAQTPAFIPPLITSIEGNNQLLSQSVLIRPPQTICAPFLGCIVVDPGNAIPVPLGHQIQTIYFENPDGDRIKSITFRMVTPYPPIALAYDFYPNKTVTWDMPVQDVGFTSGSILFPMECMTWKTVTFQFMISIKDTNDLQSPEYPYSIECKTLKSYGGIPGENYAHLYKPRSLNIEVKGTPFKPELQILDPNPIFLNSGGSVITDPEKLARGGRFVTGAAADGVTRLLLRSQVPEAGTVEYCLVNATAPQDGRIMGISDSGGSSCTVASTTQTSNGFMTYAIYRSPENFNQQNGSSRSVKVRMNFTPYSNGEQVTAEQSLNLVRPPLVLIHGIWSSPITWSDSVLTVFRGAGFRVTQVDYQPTNAKYYIDNQRVVYDNPGGIREAITVLRATGVAATQAEVVAHSMGGILTRYYAATQQYKRAENFFEGDVNRLITFDTPHLGSPWADFLIENQSALDTIVLKLMGSITQGAVTDLRWASPAVRVLQQTPIPSHALIGINTPGFDLEQLPEFDRAMIKLVDFLLISRDLVFGESHDTTVGRTSQAGGLSGSAITEFGFPDGAHFNNTKSTLYANEAVRLLNADIQSNQFAFFPSAESLLPPPSVPLPVMGMANEISSAAEVGMQITAPAANAIVQAGSAVNFTVVPNAGTSVSRVMLVGPGVSLIDNAAPFEFALPIGAERLGSMEFQALGANPSSQYFLSNVVNLSIQTTAQIASITASPQNSLLFATGNTVQIRVLGSFNDGVSRDLTSSVTGTTYTVGNSSVLSVSANGLVTAVASRGSSSILVQNGGATALVTVEVAPTNAEPVAHAGADQTAALNSVVTLNGSASYDFDNGPQALVYEWSQLVGPAVTLSQPAGVMPQFTADSVGDYTFALVVRDGDLVSSVDYVTVKVAPLDPEGAAPALNYVTSLPITLSWGRISSAVEYQVQLGRSLSFMDLLDFTAFVPGSSQEVVINTLPSGTNTFYWRVRARQQNGPWGQWSAVQTFLFASP